jgi:hypothetical protein
MMLIGLLLAAAAAVTGVAVAGTNDAAIDVDAFGRTISTNTGSLLVGGIVIGLVAAVGAMLVIDGMRRRRAISTAAHRDREERERLEATLEEERTAREYAETASRAAMARVRAQEDADERLDLRDRSTLPPPPPPPAYGERVGAHAADRGRMGD